MDQFATHIPLLAAAASFVCGEKTRAGSPCHILELGAGEYSTPMLHEIAGACDGKVLTLDMDAEWLERYADLMRDFHELRVVADWAAEAAIDQPWDLAFVDHGPTERRRFDLERLVDCGGIVVVHDTEPNTAYGFDQVLPRFRYQRTCKRWQTWATICSNTIDVSDFRFPISNCQLDGNGEGGAS